MFESGDLSRSFEYCTIWHSSSRAALEMSKLVEQCRLTDSVFSTDGRLCGHAPLASRAGFAAEEIHALTYNLEAILHGKETRAFTDRYPGSPLAGNDPACDIVVCCNGEQKYGAQLKYYRTPEKTANACRDIRDGGQHYESVDAMVVPAEQLDGCREAARRTELRNQEIRPEVADAARTVQQKATDRLEYDGVSSRPLSKKEAEQIAGRSPEGKKLYSDIQNEYKDRSTLKQTGSAMVSAAVTSTVVAGTLNIINYLNLVRKNEISPEEAVKKILTGTAIAVCDSSLKAGGATATVSLTARTFPDLFSGSLFSQTMVAGSVAGSAVCAIDLIGCAVSAAAGKMSLAELEERVGKNVFQTAAGTWGASLGAVIGAPAGPLGSMLCSMFGGMISSMVMSLAIENHIERPFRELVKNEKNLLADRRSLLSTLENLSRIDFQHQQMLTCGAFEDFAWQRHEDKYQSQRNISALLDLGIDIE